MYCIGLLRSLSENLRHMIKTFFLLYTFVFNTFSDSLVKSSVLCFVLSPLMLLNKEKKKKNKVNTGLHVHVHVHVSQRKRERESERVNLYIKTDWQSNKKDERNGKL